MKKIMYLCAVAIFILACVGLTSAVSANTIRVGLVRAFDNRESIAILSESIEVGRSAEDGAFEYIRTLNSPSGFVVRMENGQVTLQANEQTVFTFVNDAEGAPQIQAANNEPLSMGTYYFRGVMEFRPSSTGDRLSAINVICLEEYLYGVVAMEMSPTFYTEALRAQAVAARTFAMHTQLYSTYTARGFDLCDRTCCQAYRGAGREEDLIIQAVRDTRGLMMFTEESDTPAFTPFFSSSGGATDYSENVWGGSLSHLRATEDIYEHNPRLWTRTYTWAQLTAAVQAQAPSANIGTVTSIEVTTHPLGRVQALTFIGTNGRWTATRQAVSGVFRHIDSALYSRNFYIVGGSAVSNGLAANEVPVINLGQAISSTIYVFDGVSTRQLTQSVTVTGGTGITINGRGWGHGVGMSQHGANGMAQAGYSFRQILKHYYTGITIQEWTPNKMV
ncbi:MAG: SpoIID/LytB domain-containing protein [Defluviitaleaceae bacterium]|nr:SpoIID/LytB domain-containing protein [Defluviitaleaceae bacterium]